MPALVYPGRLGDVALPSTEPEPAFALPTTVGIYRSGSVACMLALVTP